MSNETLGDGIPAYFGFPRAHDDDDERAVLAGLDTVAPGDSRRLSP